MRLDKKSDVIYASCEEPIVKYFIVKILNRFNFWIHSVLIKLLPCGILIVISAVLMHVLCEASRRRLKLRDYNNPAKYAIQLNLNETKSKK